MQCIRSNQGFSAPPQEDELSFVEPPTGAPADLREGTIYLIQSKKYPGKRIGLVNGKVLGSTACDETVQWTLDDPQSGFYLLRCHAPGGPYNLRLGSQSGTGFDLTADSCESTLHRWRPMKDNEGWFSLVNNAEVTRKIQIKDGKRFSAGRCAMRCSDDFLFHFIDLDPYRTGMPNVDDAVKHVQQLVSARTQQIEINHQRAERLAQSTKRMKASTKALADKFSG